MRLDLNLASISSRSILLVLPVTIADKLGGIRAPRGRVD